VPRREGELGITPLLFDSMGVTKGRFGLWVNFQVSACRSSATNGRRARELINVSSSLFLPSELRLVINDPPFGFCRMLRSETTDFWNSVPPYPGTGRYVQDFALSSPVSRTYKFEPASLFLDGRRQTSPNRKNLSTNLLQSVAILTLSLCL